MGVIAEFGSALLDTVRDLLPIVVLFAVFQFGVLRRRMPEAGRVLIGTAYVVIGLALFRTGLYASLIPTGESMARQLGQLAEASDAPTWRAYLPVAAFAASLGFAATMIEPTLLAVAKRVRDLSGGTVSPWTLRIVVALGVAGGLALGTVRIVAGIPIETILIGLVVLLALLVIGAPRSVAPLALDSGAIATSVVTVPLIAAYGIALAETVPGRSVLIDGFGLIVLALFGPAVALLSFAQAYRLYQNVLKRGERRAVQTAGRTD